MNLLTIIMTHTEALPTVKRHLPIWENCPGKIYFTSPLDKPMGTDGFLDGISLGYPERKIGMAEHHGELSAQRIIEIFKFALEQKYNIITEWDYLLLMEYDSFALALPEKVMPGNGGVAAITYSQNKPMKFRGSFYLHYPMLFTRTGFEKVAKVLPEIKSNDRYYSDRFIGRAVEMANIPVKNLRRLGLGYSKNTIEPHHHLQLKKAVKNGALFFHGVKDIQTLGCIYEIPKIEPIK